MPARRVYSRWDSVWVLDQTIERNRRVRFVPRLGRKRPLWERLFRGARAVPVVVLVLIGSAAAGLTSAAVKIPREPLGGSEVLGAIVYLACLAGALRLMSAGDDVRCVVSARERRRLAANPDRRALAAEIMRRRRRWEEWLKESHSLKLLVCLRSVAFFASIVAFFVSSFVLQLWRSHAAWSTARQGERILEMVYGGALVAMVATGIWTWRRIKRMLADSLNGQVCPDCGYAIVTGEVAKTSQAMDVAIGPVRCSECGCPWPLVPPQRREVG